MKNSLRSGRSDWTRGGHTSRRRRTGKRRAGRRRGGGGTLVLISRNAELSDGSDFGGQTPPSARRGRVCFSAPRNRLRFHVWLL